MTENNNQNNSENNEEINVIEEYVEGYWICPNCSAKCRGAEQGCSACGAVRGENVEFFCDDDAPAITDESELEKAKAGPDWICKFCGNTSPSASPKCTGCGSYREDGKKRQVKEVKEKPETPTAEPPKPLPMGCKIGCSIFAVLLLILMAFSCQQKSGQLEVLSASWQRTIEREQYKTVRESAWKNEVPTGAREISRNREIRKYNEIPDGFEEVNETYTEQVKVGEKKVKDGKVNLGNGRFKVKYKTVPEYKSVTKTRRVKKQKYRKEPVYDTKVTYDIEKWTPIDKVVASGVNDEPHWPETKAESSGSTKIGAIREGKKSETFKVKAKRVDNGEEYEFDKIGDKPLTLDQFMKLRKGSKWEAIFSGLGALREIKFDPTKK